MSHPLQLIIRFLLAGVSVLIVAAVMPGMKVRRYTDAVAFAIVVAIFNVIAWGLFGLVTWPFAVLTLGIGYLIVNGMVFLVAQKVVTGVEFSGCVTAAIASVLVGLVNSVIHGLLT